MTKLNTNILVVIPARGGSKGIPRKNLRNLASKPLLYYGIKTALASRYTPDVYVSSDDDEILSISKKLGAETIKRDALISGDTVTLDPVIYNAYQEAQRVERKEYDLIITMQPTSPLLKTKTLDMAIEAMLAGDEFDTVIAAKEDTHLTWKQEKGIYYPNYKRRVNRQYLTPIFKETGGFLITRNSVISKTNRIGNRVKLQMLDAGEDIDIDTYEDWNLCEYYLKRKRLLFVVSGFKDIGLGHVYNTLLLANNILNHQIEFLVDKKSQLAFDKITSKNYQVYMQKHDDIVDDIKELSPSVVINDILDTNIQYVQSLKSLGVKVINFEDLGAGALEADLVINAIYPEKSVIPKHYFGHDYFVLRDEFILTEPKLIVENVRHILLTFGGVDPNNFTEKVIAAIQEYCQKSEIDISVVTGFGYDKYESLKKFKNITIYQNSSAISEHMKKADIIFTSAGRTTYEAASLNVPTIVLAQNKRELTHLFASGEYGFINMGLGIEILQKEIIDTLRDLVNNFQARTHMSKLMAKTDLLNGRKRTLKLINELVELT